LTLSASLFGRCSLLCCDLSFSVMSFWITFVYPASELVHFGIPWTKFIRCLALVASLLCRRSILSSYLSFCVMPLC
jgi:hypothetical protein